jgi:hypothetical protein
MATDLFVPAQGATTPAQPVMNIASLTDKELQLYESACASNKAGQFKAFIDAVQRRATARVPAPASKLQWRDYLRAQECLAYANARQQSGSCEWFDRYVLFFYQRIAAEKQLPACEAFHRQLVKYSRSGVPKRLFAGLDALPLPALKEEYILGNTIPFDDGIIRLLKALANAGVYTAGSCQGHLDARHHHFPWVSFYRDYAPLVERLVAGFNADTPSEQRYAHWSLGRDLDTVRPIEEAKDEFGLRMLQHSADLFGLYIYEHTAGRK